MTKSEFISNLKLHEHLLNSSWSRFEPIIYAACLIALVGKSFFELSGIIFDLMSVTLVVIMLWLLLKSNSNKKIDEQCSMFCEQCEIRFEEETLAYAVLVNECQNCKNPIYET